MTADDAALDVLRSVVGGKWSMRQVRFAKPLPADVWVIEDDDGDEVAYVGHRIDAAAIVAAVNAGRDLTAVADPVPASGSGGPGLPPTPGEARP